MNTIRRLAHRAEVVVLQLVYEPRYSFSYLFSLLLTGLLLAVIILIPAAPALIAFEIASRDPELYAWLYTAGLLWLFALLFLIILLMIIFTARSIREHRYKKQLIRKYKRKNRNRFSQMK